VQWLCFVLCPSKDETCATFYLPCTIPWLQVWAAEGLLYYLEPSTVAPMLKVGRVGSRQQRKERHSRRQDKALLHTWCPCLAGQPEPQTED
jgi:hypothetical protein